MSRCIQSTPTPSHSLRGSQSQSARRAFLLKRLSDPKLKTSELQSVATDASVRVPPGTGVARSSDRGGLGVAVGEGFGC